MKQFLSSCAIVAILLAFSVEPMHAQVIDNIAYNMDTLQRFIAGPGTEYLSIRMKEPKTGERLDVFILRVDTKNPYVSFEQHLGSGKLVGVETPTNMALRNTTDTHIAFGGTNGDFFLTSGDVGRPTGLTIGNSEYAFIGEKERHCGGINAQGRPQLAINWEYSGSLLIGDASYTIHHVNYTRHTNELVLYNYHNGASTGTSDEGAEAILSLLPGEKWATSGQMKAVVKQVIPNKGNTTIEKDKFILSGLGTSKSIVESLKVGDEVTISYSLKFDGEEVNMAQCIGSDNYAEIILNDGVVPTVPLWDSRHPRTAFGHTITGDTVVMCVVDGRGSSWGCTTNFLGHLMRHYGAWKAVNWDGGGSSCMYLQIFGQVNRPSDGVERATCNSMLVFANIPEKDTEISVIRSYDPELVMSKYATHRPKFLGYNKYDVLLNPDVKGVTLTTDEHSGYIHEDGSFVCLNSGSFTAHYNGATVTIPVQVVEPDEYQLRLDSVLVSDDTNYPIEVLSILGKTQSVLDPSVVTWTIEDPEVCSISLEGYLNGLQDGGRTRVFAELDNFRDTLIVNVQIPASKHVLLTNMSNATDIWSIKTLPSSLKTDFRTNDKGQGVFWMNFTGGRAANTKFTMNKPLYSLPQYVEMCFNAQGFPIERAMVGFKANNSKEVITLEYSADQLVLNGPTSLRFNIDSILGVNNDIAIYPVTWDYLTFYYNLKAEKQEYEMLVEGIYLHYGEITLAVDGVTMPSFTIYPNPVVNDMLTITGATATMAMLYDLQGRLIAQTAIHDTNAQMNIAGLAAGTYLLTIGNETVKIIKK